MLSLISKFIGVVALLLVLCSASPVFAVTVVTTSGAGSITFCEDRTQGTYNNGDKYVVVGAGVTICDKEFKDTDGVAPTLHGCEVNPTPTNVPTSYGNGSGQGTYNGFDSRLPSGNFYAVGWNLCNSFPSASIPAGSSLLIAKSCNPLCGLASVRSIYLEYVDVITIVSAAPACGSGCAFRPPYYSTNKTLVSAVTSDIRFNVLPDWTSQGALPVAATLGADDRYWRRPHLGQMNPSGGTAYQNLEAYRNIPSTGSYGQGPNYGLEAGMLALATNTSDANKQALAIKMIQYGIDVYGFINAGIMYEYNGGHCVNDKAMMVLAASLLDHAAMMTAATSNAWKFCSSGPYLSKYITAQDVATPRAAGCGDNNADPTAGRCAPFTDGTSGSVDMRGRAMGCNARGTWYNTGGSECSSKIDDVTPDYLYWWSPQVGIALVLSEMSLEEEYAWPAYFDFALGRIPAGEVAWEANNRYYNYFRVDSSVGTPCSGSVATSNHAIRAGTCEAMDVHRAGAATDGSIGSGGEPPDPPNEAPNAPVLTSPSASTTHVTTSATITLGGTSSDPDGTIASTTAVSDMDASVTNAGTATAWSFVPDLPANSVSIVTLTATDDEAATASATPINVLRTSSTCTGLADTFDLSGTWPTPNPYCWVQMAGSLVWTNNNIVPGTSGRNFYYFNSAVNNDQQAAITLGTTPATGVFYLWGVRGGAPTPGTVYTGVACSAENIGSVIAKYTPNGTGGVTRTALSGNIVVAWVQGDVATCQGIGQEYCVLQNGVERGCATDSGASYTSGFGFAGGWGTAPFDNFVVSAAAGAGDITAPLMTFTTPASPIQVGTTPYTAVAGTATDAVGVVECDWLIVENPTEAGMCDNVTLPDTAIDWEIASIDLITGVNTIQVRTEDAAGNQTTVSQTVTYIPATTVTGSLTRPNTELTSTQVGDLIHLEGSFTPGQCVSVLLRNVSDPDPEIGGSVVVATGTDNWVARVKLVPQLNTIEIDCMDMADGEGESLGTVTKIVNSVSTRKRR